MSRNAFAPVISRADTGRFGLGLVEEDEPGYWPQAGLGSFASFEEAGARASELNAELGLSEETAAMIVCSSMRRQLQ